MAKVKGEDKILEWIEEGRKYIRCFPSSFQVIFPSKCDKCPEAIETIRKTWSEELGGTTEWDGYGCWLNEKGEAVCEDVKIIMSAHNCTDPQSAEKVGNAVLKAGRIAEQEEVIVSAGNKFFFFKTK